MTGPRRFDPQELGTGTSRELDDAQSTAEWLDASMLDAPIRPAADFADRVMAALEAEPTPAAAGFLSPVRRRGFLSGFASSVRQAWASAFTSGRPAMVRASALAYVLAVAIAGTALAGAATIGVGSALGIIGPASTQTSSPTTGPTDLAEPSGLEPPESGVPEASEEPGESDSPDASDDHGGSSGPDASDDHGGGDGSGPASSDGGDDHSGPGSTDSGSDDHEGSTPRPSGTQRPSETPKPTSTSGSGGDG